MTSIITSIKKIKKGESVGYSRTFIAEKDITIATIPAGYFEGMDRRLSNIGFVEIGNTHVPFVGRISMNISTVDITNVATAKRDDEVVLISSKKENPNSIESMARLAKTIPYEIAIHIPGHLKRTLVD